jgi:protein TonB
MFSQRRQQSPTVLVTVMALHVAALAALLYYQPALHSAQANVMHVSMITLPQPLPAVQPAPPKPRKVEITIPIQRAIAPPLEAPSQTAISVASPPPASAEPVETEAAAAPQEPPAPLVLPRFDAAYLQNPAPAYPALSRRTGEQGKVLLRVVVRPDGAPETVELRQSSGAARLDEAALEAVRKWRFVPARRGDMPVTAAVIVPVVFTLQGSGA